MLPSDLPGSTFVFSSHLITLKVTEMIQLVLRPTIRIPPKNYDLASRKPGFRKRPTGLGSTRFKLTLF